MAKTNWQDPKTSEIMSSHISGLQEAVGKIEESIGIDTVAETDIPMTEVFISNDDRCRIYQAPDGKRNWLLSPTPVIKKNGIIILNDFEIDYGGGVIVFTTPILEDDILTADATYTKKIEGKQLSTNDYTDEEKDKNQSNKENIHTINTTINQSDYTTSESTISSIISNPADITEGTIKLNAKGRTIVNSVYNGNFKNGTDGWIMSACTLSASDGVAKFTGTGLDRGPNIHIPRVVNGSIGKQLFLKSKVRVLSEDVQSIRLYTYASGVPGSNLLAKLIENPIKDTWYNLYGIVTLGELHKDKNISLYLNTVYTTAESSNGKSTEVKDVMLLDLDNHPDLKGLTAEQINERVPNYVDGVQGSDGLLIKSIGKNLLKGYDRNTKVKVPSGGILDVPINVNRNMNMELSVYNANIPTPGAIGMRSKDKSEPLITAFNGTGDKTSTFNTGDNDVIYLRFYSLDIEKVITYDMAMLSYLVDDMTYEPYQESSSFLTEGLYQLPNGVRDEIVDNRLIKRVDTSLILDGSEGWSDYNAPALTNTLVFRCTKPEMMPSFWGGLTGKGIISTNFHNGGGIIYGNDIEGIATDDNLIVIRVNKNRLSSPNATGFKQWLSNNPQTVYYQLVEPKVKQLNLPINAYKDGHVMVEGWGNYKLKSNDIVQLDNSTLSEVDIARTPERFLKNVTTLSNELNPLEIRGKTQVANKGPQVNNVNAIGSYYATSIGALVFIYPKNKYKLQDIKSVLEGTKIYYKLGSEYWVNPEWSVTYTTTLLSQINDSSKSISKLNEITQEHSDILATHGIRLDAMQGIVESGENANGRYVRFADGTQVCFMEKNVDMSIGVFQPQLFPANFITIPSCSGSMSSNKASGTATDAEYWDNLHKVNVLSEDTTLFRILIRNSNISSNGIAKVTAIGRWK